jgi:hypothetical protein
VQIYGEVVRERTTDRGHNRVYEHDAKGPRHRRSRHPGVNRKKHRLHQEINPLLGKNGVGASSGNSGKIGQVQEEMGQNKQGNE